MSGLVTGGAGGIGRRIAAAMVAEGYAVTIVDVDTDRAEAVASEVGARALVQDCTTPEGAERAVAAACDADGRLRALVNCLGISPKSQGRRRPLQAITLAEWEQVMAVNVTAPFLVTQAAADRLEPRRGAIVNLLSIMAKLGAAGPDDVSYGPISPSGAHYAASKAALWSLTISTARELAPAGVRCNGVAPGQVGRGMGGSIDEAFVDRMIGQVPLGRPATADEVSDAVLFLLSDRASYITGETLDVDGGWFPD